MYSSWSKHSSRTTSVIAVRGNFKLLGDHPALRVTKSRVQRLRLGPSKPIAWRGVHEALAWMLFKPLSKPLGCFVKPNTRGFTPLKAPLDALQTLRAFLSLLGSSTKPLKHLRVLHKALWLGVSTRASWNIQARGFMKPHRDSVVGFTKLPRVIHKASRTITKSLYRVDFKKDQAGRLKFKTNSSAKNCMKCPNMHRKVMFANPYGGRVGRFIPPKKDFMLET